jgi:hypothetical protein
MAKFTSRFPELGFYVGGEFRRFHMGEFTTEDKAEIEVLEKLTDASASIRSRRFQKRRKRRSPLKKRLRKPPVNKTEVS